MSAEAKSATSASHEAAQWTWITASDTESRRRAKAHASREVKRRKAIQNQKARDRKPGRRQLLLPATSTAKSKQSSELAQRAKWTLIPDPASPLGAGRVDPFANYPVLFETTELRELVDHFLFTAPSLQSKPQKRVCFLPLFQEIRRVSFELAQDDPAAFNTILAIASADRSILHDEKEPVQAIAHNTYSIRMLNERISDVENATTDKTITTVALQIIFLLLFEDCDAVQAHADALESIVKMRGGLECFELSNPQLALLINLADYLPPATALTGRRKFHLIDSAISDAAQLSPVALLAPNGLEALAHFDMYFDISRICLNLQRTTDAAFAGDFWTSSVTETRLKSQLRDLLAMGTSNTAWGRRCEIMKCVCLAALIYTRVISRKDLTPVAAQQQLLELLAKFETSLAKRPFEELIEGLLQGESGDCFERLAASMRTAALLDQLSWYGIRRQLQDLFLEVYDGPVQTFALGQGHDEQEIEMAGLTALFGFFNLAGS